MIEIVSKNPKDYIEVALAVEILSCHNRFVLIMNSVTMQTSQFISILSKVGVGIKQIILDKSTNL